MGLFMNYTERLIRFNSSDKYRSEMEFLLRLINPKPGDQILDYGCGIGTCLNYIREKSGARLSGFDITYHGTGDLPDWFTQQLSSLYDVVYFMHSLAHIENVEDVLGNIKKKLNASSRIIVITPNSNWDSEMKPVSSNYKPDTTVVKHFTPEELERIFINSGYKVDLLGQFGKPLNGHNERIFMVASI